MNRNINITLDGPSGSGKTTIAKSLAKRLGYLYCDTGAMYRAVAHYMFANGIPFKDEERIKANLDNVNLDLNIESGEQRVIVNGKDITGEIRTQEMSMGASDVSKIMEVRLKLVAMQREIARKQNAIFDGRDMGSFVLPEADYKFYITADVDERANRRYIEQKARGLEVTFEGVKSDMIARDEQERSRAFAPLVIPQAAFVIDTTNMSINEVEDLIFNRVTKSK